MTRPEASAAQFTDIPQGWKVIRINQMCKVRRGASPRPIGDTSYFSDNGRGWIRITDVTAAYKHLKKTSQYLSPKGEAKSVKVDPGDLIMSICATIGKPIIVDIPACIHDGFVWFSNLSQEVDTEFLFYALRQREQEFVSKKQTGTQGNLNTKLIGKTEILLPPLLEQEKIVSILSTVDDSIQQSGTVINETQHLKQGLMHQLFSGGIEHRRFKHTDIGDMPADWNIVEIKDICTIKRGASPRPIGDRSYFSTTGRGWIRINDVTAASKYLENTSEYLSPKGEAKSVKVDPGDLIMSICATIGKPIIVDIPACIHDGFVYFSELSHEIDTEFLFYVLQYKEQELISKKQLGTQGNLNTRIVSRTIIPLPSLREQKEIASILSYVDQKLKEERSVKEYLARLRKGLMDDLLTGKVRVN